MDGRTGAPPSAAGIRRLGRALSSAENTGEMPDGWPPPPHPPRVIGITGSPGAGKSSLVAALVDALLEGEASIAAILIDPSSPIHGGALLGDRIRMVRHDANPRVFVRSLATRGAFGGVPRALPLAVDLIASSGFDWILVETVGTGQTDTAVASVVDTTVLVLSPESGDEVQAEKAGILEIADVLVVNKADRPGAAAMAGHLRDRAAQRARAGRSVPVISTTAPNGDGLDELIAAISTSPA